MMSIDTTVETPTSLAMPASLALEGRRVAIVGKLAGMNKRDAFLAIRQHGGLPVDKLDEAIDLLVVGEAQWPMSDGSDPAELLGQQAREAVEDGELSMITETELWQQLGYLECEQNIHRLYTPAMLAKLIDVSVAVIRRWHRRGLIVPVHEVKKLPYFDFQEVTAARRLAELLAAGVSPKAIEKKLENLRRYLPHVQRPLTQLSIIIAGKNLLLRQGQGLIEPGGQRHFDFDFSEDPQTTTSPDQAEADQNILSIASTFFTQQSTLSPETLSPQQMEHLAADLEDQGRLDEAAEVYRAILLAQKPKAEIHFQLAEVLYRLDDLSAARERYYAAIEVDEDYVEARANLGCVLAELGQLPLAVAAFEGALLYHQDYSDVHYHLAKTLDELGRREQANTHWQHFLALAANTPWADEARSRLNEV